jgi:hypothetical protein
MRPTLPFQLGAEGKHIADLHRKLASIREDLKDTLNAPAYQFLCGPSTTIFGDQMRAAIIAFQDKFGVPNDAKGICDHATWDLLDQKAGSVYSEVWQFELDALRLRKNLSYADLLASQKDRAPQSPEERAAAQDAKARARSSAGPANSAEPAEEYAHVVDPGELDKRLKVQPADEDEVIKTAHAAELAGLAFSGGGIRSATFNLGILQALAQQKMLGDFDYLSTVSGGGYIGAWFSKWLHNAYGNIDTVGTGLAPGTKANPVPREPEEIRFLRQYSNYLTPKTGLFSADTWSLLATYFRNTALNMAILVALLGAALIVPRLLSFMAVAFGKDHPAMFAAVGAVAALWAVFYIALSISSIPDPAGQRWPRGQTQQSILLLVVLPLMVSAYAASVAVWQYWEQFARIWKGIPPTAAHPVLTWMVVPGVAYFGAWACGWLLAQRRKGNRTQAPLRKLEAVREGFGHFLCAVIALGVGAFLLTWSASALGRWDLARRTLDGNGQGILLVTYGMPLILSIFGISMILATGLVGRMYNDKSREWWSRQGGWAAIFTLAWLGLSVVSMSAPPMLGYVDANLRGWVEALIGSAWLGTTLAGLKLGHSSATGKRGSRPYLEWIAAIAPAVFAIGALLLVSTLAYFMMLPSVPATGWGGAAYKDWGNAFTSYFDAAHDITALKAAVVMVVLAAVGLALAWRVDVNKFSLYMMYRNRLVRAYLGAINRKRNQNRNPNPFTGFDENDDMHLDNLLATGGVIQRPYPIINAALNLVNGKELAWQNRKAGGFSFTPGFCGFELPSMASAGPAQMEHEARRGCFRPTAGYRAKKGVRGDEEASIKLGMAVAVSGAAVSPNMGYHSSPALSFLMTLFNVRLGRWFANPRRKSWRLPAPLLGIRYLIAELFGLSDADANFVYLSDGGHFENLGIYELVRRRCRLIVVIDASADGELNFEDLGNAIRKCATDLHIEIDIDARQIVPQLPDEFSRAHCVVGDILYECTDPKGKAKNGTLVYIKPSLGAFEYADILNYRKANKDFPHQSTADQWFDETQFESYRSLGYRIGMRVFGAPPGDGGAGEPSHSIPDLAEALQRQWGGKEGVTEAVPVIPTPASAPAE